MNTEQEPTALSEEQAKDLEARGSALIETNDVYNAGRLVAPNINAVNNPIERMATSDNIRFDALEAAKSGAFDGITDPTEKSALTKRFQEEGQKGLESLIESIQRKISTEPINTQQLATNLAEQQLGTNAIGTEKMDEGIQAARQGIEDALESTAPQTNEEVVPE